LGSSRRRSRVIGVGSYQQDETDIHLSDPVRSSVEPRVGDRLSNRQDHRPLRPAAIAHVGRLLSDSPSAVEIRQHTRTHGNRANVQR